MVDGVNNPRPATQYSTLKIKGFKKTIDLNNLTGLQKTQGNEALFKMYDKDGNGTIDEKEAIVMRNNLQSLAGDGTISKKEINKQFGKDSNALAQLAKLADQQAVGKNKEYIETNGNSTTHLYRSSLDSKHNYQYTTTKNSNGSTTTVFDDGTQEIKYPNGSKQVINKEGTVVSYDQKGNKISVLQNNELTRFSLDGTKSVTQNMDGQILSSKELRNGETVTTKYEYQNGNTIAREYTGEGDNTALTAVIVSGKETNSNGKTGSIESRFVSEEDMQNNRPTSELRNKGLPTEIKTEYEYDSKGNKKITETTLGNIPVSTYTDKEGNSIHANQFEQPQNYTVRKGDSITKIVTQALADQGITNPTADQLKDAKEQFMEMNKDILRTFKGKNGGRVKGFWPNDKVNIPNFQNSISNFYLDDLTVTATKPSEEIIAKKEELQAKLGDDFRVGFSQDGKSLEVMDINGNILSQATEMANTSKTSDNDDIDTMMASDQNNSKTLDQGEYKTFIMGMLQDAGFEITETNKAKIEELINNSFTSMDTIKQDGELTREELAQNAPQIISKLTEKLTELD